MCRKKPIGDLQEPQGGRHDRGFRFDVLRDPIVGDPLASQPFLDAEPTLDYVVAMAGNAVLKRIAGPAMEEARALSEASGQTAHVYLEARYATRTWRHERRVVIKAEVVRLPGRTPRDNPRFVISRGGGPPRHSSHVAAGHPASRHLPAIALGGSAASGHRKLHHDGPAQRQRRPVCRLRPSQDKIEGTARI